MTLMDITTPTAEEAELICEAEGPSQTYNARGTLKVTVQNLPQGVTKEVYSLGDNNYPFTQFDQLKTAFYQKSDNELDYVVFQEDIGDQNMVAQPIFKQATDADSSDVSELLQKS